jgi:Mrp family chromosome partitioning ATPase
LSKNFELLQRVQSEQPLPSSPAGLVKRNELGRKRSPASTLTGEEAFRLVQRLFLQPGPDAPRMVVFSGVDPGDGCSSVCVAAAEALASRVQGSFCLVDADLRTPSLHEYFGLDNQMGLIDAVAQPGPIRNFAQQVDGGNLWVMTSGSEAANVQTLINTEALRSRLADLRAEFDNVLIDAPPSNRYADAVTLGQMADGIVLVLRSNATRREAARNAKGSIAMANVRLLGAVLNGRTYPIPSGLYGKL